MMFEWLELLFAMDPTNWYVSSMSPVWDFIVFGYLCLIQWCPIIYVMIRLISHDLFYDLQCLFSWHPRISQDTRWISNTRLRCVFMEHLWSSAKTFWSEFHQRPRMIWNDFDSLLLFRLFCVLWVFLKETPEYPRISLGPKLNISIDRGTLVYGNTPIMQAPPYTGVPLYARVSPYIGILK